MLPVDEVRIDPVMVNNIGLGKSIYMKEQLEEFARFQDSQVTRKAYLAETAEMAYIGRTEKGEWGLALGLAAQDVGRKVGLMLESEAIRGPESEETDEQNMENLRKKYPSWLGGQGGGESTAPARGSGAEAEDIVSSAQGKSTKV